MSRVVLVSLCRVCIIFCFYLLFPCHATNVLKDMEQAGGSRDPLHWLFSRSRRKVWLRGVVHRKVC